MAGNTARERELREQLLEPSLILTDVRIDLTIGTFKISIAHQCRPTVSGTGDVNHIQIILLDDPVQVHVDEVLARRRAPVSHHQRFHVR